MNERIAHWRGQWLLFSIGLGLCFLMFTWIVRHLFWFSDVQHLGAMIAIEVVLICLWQFEKLFLPATMLCFLSAGTGLPFGDESTSIRWLFLGIGALAGFFLWMRSNRAQHFGAFHLFALLAVLSAVGSASSSDQPVIAMLKAGSLLLLFLFAATAGRVAIAQREKSFVAALVWGCEISLFVTGAWYMAGANLFGNPNNLGAYVGVVATPLVLWAALVSAERRERQRHYLALGVCCVLLYLSACRAAIVADAAILIFLTFALRRPQLLWKAMFATALALQIIALFNPSGMHEFTESMTGRLILKTDANRPAGGIFTSRKAPWDASISAIQAHPWLGTGFGTSDMGNDPRDVKRSTIYTREGSNREHGSSYLALLEYMGFIGVLPFVILLFLLLRAARHTFAWVRRGGSFHDCAVPFAMIAVAGLIHAAFEDWLFAAGSYLCFFFWVSAFLLVDLAPQRKTQFSESVSLSFPYAPAQSVNRPAV